MGEDLWVVGVKDGKVVGGNDAHSRTLRSSIVVLTVAGMILAGIAVSVVF